MENKEENFDDEIDADLNVWLPEKEGDTLIGKVVEINPETLYGYALKVKTDDEEVFQTPAHKYLQSRLVQLALNDRIKIVYTGTEIAKSTGRRMNTYTLHRKGIDKETGL